MAWREVSDLPFAAVLTPHQGGLAPAGQHDCVRFDALTFDGPDAGGSSFLECAFTQVTVQDTKLRRARFTDVLLRDVRLIASSLAETGWADVTFDGCVAAGVEVFAARLRRVTLRGCKLDSVNFRDAQLSDVTFEDCVLKDVDFAGAALTRTAFPGCRLSGTDFSRVRLDKVDLRGAELGIIIDPPALRGAIVTTAQLLDMAPLLASSLGIVVDDG
jgi:uncharacterized protein YjbI with pentapeptide repeats